MLSIISKGAHWRLSGGAALVLLVSACGGGGGSKNDTQSSTPPSSKISLGGVVSKGLTGNALVNVYGVSGSGAVDTGNVLATGQTNDSGVYSTTEFLAPATYVVEVSAKDCADTASGAGCSYHLDEKTSTRQYLPSGFKMRAVVTTTPSDKKVNITPFSEMAVSAAQSAAGGITLSNANQAIAMANNLVGVTDLNAVTPTVLSDTAATSDQLRLAALLAAVSNVASASGSLANVGCSTQTAGTPDATKCVVEKLAANASVTNYVGSVAAVTTALNTELQNVVATKPEVQALVESTSKKLTDPTITVPATAVATRSPIDLVKDFINDMMSTFHTLLNSGASPGQGATLSEAHAFDQAVAGANFQGLTIQRTIQTLQAAASLWNNYDHGATSRVSFYGQESYGFPQVFEGNQKFGLNCVLEHADYTALAPNESAANIDHVTCTADYVVTVVGAPVSTGSGTYTQSGKRAYHQFEVRKNATLNNHFGVTTWTTVDDITISYSTTTGPTGMTRTGSINGFNSFTNSDAISTTLDSVGRIQSIHIDAPAPDGFNTNATLVHASASPNGAYTHVVADAVTSNLVFTNPAAVDSSVPSGTITFSAQADAYAADGSTIEAAMTLGTGSFLTFGSNELNNSKLVLALKVPAHASYPESNLVGTLEATRSVSSASHAQEYGQGQFVGSLFNGPSTGVPFVSGTFKFAIKDTNYDATQLYSSSNYQEATASIDAYVTAPSNPKLRMIIGMSGRKSSYQYNISWDDYGTIAGNIIAYNADGTTKRDAYLTIAPATTPASGTTMLVYGDATNKIKISQVDGQRYSDVLVDGNKVGVYDKDSGRIDFTDGSFIVPDFGEVVY